MAYNHSQAEAEWKREKMAEEAVLREHGMSEEKIEELRESDWADFKSNRVFYLHNVQLLDDTEGINLDAAYTIENMDSKDISNVSDLLDEIENERLYKILSETDELTMHILLLRLCGYSFREIYFKLNVNEKTVFARIKRLKEYIVNNAKKCRKTAFPIGYKVKGLKPRTSCCFQCG